MAATDFRESVFAFDLNKAPANRGARYSLALDIVAQSGQADTLYPDKLSLRQLTVAVRVEQFLDFRRSATALAFDRMIHARQRAEFSLPPVDAVGQLLTFKDGPGVIGPPLNAI